MTAVDITVPDIGDFKDVGVIEILVKPGDTVTAEQSLITVESDKASMEIPSSHAGVVQSLKVALGDRVKQGSPILVLEVAGSAGAAAPASNLAAAPPAAPAPLVLPPATQELPPPALAQSPAAATAPSPSSSSTSSNPSSSAMVPAVPPSATEGLLPHASPSVRKLARELGVPLAEVPGSGPKGRITPQDVTGFVKQVMQGDAQTQAQKDKGVGRGSGGGLPGLLPWPQVDFSKFGPIERKDLSRIQKISGANLHRNWVVIPHVTNFEQADITDLEALRVSLNQENAKTGPKVTLLAFLIKAMVVCLQKFPTFNSSLEGDALVLKRYFHIGFAADTPNGLVVPVIKNADQKGILAISQEMNDLAQKAREGKLSPADMSGGSISISSLGGIGGTGFTPIINAPEVAILGVCKSQMEPRWDGHQFVPRLILPLSLSWDHRVIDGANAARFLVHFASLLADFRRISL